MRAVMACGALSGRGARRRGWMLLFVFCGSVSKSTMKRLSAGLSSQMNNVRRVERMVGRVREEGRGGK